MTFSRPTQKAGVPHVIASDELLRQMLTLRIHLDEVTDENGPLRVIPQSHISSDSVGLGVDHAVTIYASAGDVLAMRPLISHASGAPSRARCVTAASCTWSLHLALHFPMDTNGMILWFIEADLASGHDGWNHFFVLNFLSDRN